MSQKASFDLRLKSFQDIAKVERVFEARPLVQQNRELLVLVVREQVQNVVFQCPCGCGDILVISVNPNTAAFWEFRYKKNKLTLIPSIWRNQGCKSHFILRENRVFWCNSRKQRDLIWFKTVSFIIKNLHKYVKFNFQTTRDR